MSKRQDARSTLVIKSTFALSTVKLKHMIPTQIRLSKIFSTMSNFSGPAKWKLKTQDISRPAGTL